MDKKIISRRNFLKGTAIAGFHTVVPSTLNADYYARAIAFSGLSNPLLQPKFTTIVPNAFSNQLRITKKWRYKRKQNLRIVAAQYNHLTGLVDSNGSALITPVWGYGKRKSKVNWPGGMVETYINKRVRIKWKNKLIQNGQPLPHLLPVDTSFHWAFGIHGYKQYSIENNGVPLVPHVHGAHVNSSSDGNPEYFFTPNWVIKGPRWVRKRYKYDNTQEAGALWYHDHSLGLTRLNVYAGLAGFYIIRDSEDTGRHNNPVGLPAEEYELGYVIQDRMFKDTGELFFPAYPNDPAYEGFITNENVTLPLTQFPNGGPTILPEFFGDHIVVNGKIWPKADVEPRHYRLRLLNGCDSRFLAIRFRLVASGSTTISGTEAILPFWHVGGDQGLASSATQLTQLVVAPAERPDIVFDFSSVPMGSRVIMENIAGDAPFSGLLVTDTDFEPTDVFSNRQTDKIMAFDINKSLSNIADSFDASSISHYEGNNNPVDKIRKVALFEGRDEFNRLQPMLGVAEPTIDMDGNEVNGTLTWHQPISENPIDGTTEVWEIYNNTEDAHPVHVHLVNFEILNRQKFTTTIVPQDIILHNGEIGKGFYMENTALVDGTVVNASTEEKSPRDMVICYPNEVTRIKMTFDKIGRYVWHCHILSHEDHDMMRPLYVSPIV